MALPWIVVIEDLPTLILHSSLNPSLPSLSPRPSGQCANLICPNQQASLSPKDHCVPRPYPQLEQSLHPECHPISPLEAGPVGGGAPPTGLPLNPLIRKHFVSFSQAQRPGEQPEPFGLQEVPLCFTQPAPALPSSKDGGLLWLVLKGSMQSYH